MGKAKKTGLLVAGTVAGASLLLLNPNARSKVKEKSTEVKDTVNKYATTIKEDPQGSKDAIIRRIQNATDTSKESISKIQGILDNRGKDIKETAKHAVQDTKHTASDTKKDLQVVKDNATMETKHELESTKDDLSSKETAPKTTSRTTVKDPIN